MIEEVLWFDKNKNLITTKLIIEKLQKLEKFELTSENLFTDNVGFDDIYVENLVELMEDEDEIKVLIDNVEAFNFKQLSLIEIRKKADEVRNNYNLLNKLNLIR